MTNPPIDPKDRPRSAYGVAYEPRDLETRGIVRTVIFLFAMVIGVYIFCTIFGKAMLTHWTQEAGTLPVVHPLPPEPRLEVEGPQRIAELHASEDKLLQFDGLVDATHGRIPIARAMEIVAQKGLPTRAAASGTSQ